MLKRKKPEVDDPDVEEAGAGIEVVLSQAGEFMKFAGGRFGEDRCLRMAAGLSYTSLLAIVPLTAIAFSMLAAFPVFEGVRESFQEAMFSNLLPQTAEATRDYFNQFVQNTTTLSAVGIVALALTAILLLGTIEADMNAIFRVTRPRALAPRLLVFWALLTLGPLLLGASFSLVTYFYAATRWVGIDTEAQSFSFFITLLPSLMIIVMLTVFYVIIPNRPVGLTAGLVGGITAGIAFTLLRKIFGWYVITFPTYQNIYGALSVVPIFLVWMYLSWLIVLMGAVLTASTSEWQTAGGKPLSSNLGSSMRLVLALQVIAVIFHASRDGAGAVSRSKIMRETGGGGEAVDRLLYQLRAARYLDRTTADKWALVRDPEKTTVYDLYYALGLGFGNIAAAEGDEVWRKRLAQHLQTLKQRNQDLFSVTLKEILDDDGTEPALREVKGGLENRP